MRHSIAQLSVALEKAYGKARVANIETRVGARHAGWSARHHRQAFEWI